MELHELLSYIEQYGYWALFFCLWLGIIGMPIPDEMISNEWWFCLFIRDIKCHSSIFINIFRRCIRAIFRLYIRENIWYESTR